MNIEKAGGWLGRLRSGLSRTAKSFNLGVNPLLKSQGGDDSFLNQLEDQLISADLGLVSSQRIARQVADLRLDQGTPFEKVREILANEIEQILYPLESEIHWSSSKPFVLLVVGVNGTGKTTTIGKIACRLQAEGRSVVLAACDTFRAAAVDQLVIWGERASAEVVSGKQGVDAAGLAFDAVDRAQKNNRDVVLIDTAGRLQNNDDLMAELSKIIRVIKKKDSSAPHGVLLVLDATTGQNATSQVVSFSKACGITGIAMTKLDGTARGGMLVSIAAEQKTPIIYVGVGEGINDLQAFNAKAFSRALLGIEM